MRSLKLYSILILSLMPFRSFSQQLAHITIDNRGNADVISFLIDGNIFIDISKDGKILQWGVQDETPGPKTFPPKLAKYMGREEYYASTDDEAYQGKLKYIGMAYITYYTSSDDASLKGKVKTIGSMVFNYYMSYEDAAYKGFIKSAGASAFTYYASYEDESYKGKIKSAGSVNLVYYGHFDDKAYQGKVKSIDRTSFTYYSSYDRPEFKGMLKSGSQIAFAGGIQFLIKNY